MYQFISLAVRPWTLFVLLQFTRSIFTTQKQKMHFEKVPCYCVITKNCHKGKNISYQVALLLFYVMVVLLFSQMTCSGNNQQLLLLNVCT